MVERTAQSPSFSYGSGFILEDCIEVLAENCGSKERGTPYREENSLISKSMKNPVQVFVPGGSYGVWFCQCYYWDSGTYRGNDVSQERPNSLCQVIRGISCKGNNFDK